MSDNNKTYHSPARLTLTYHEPDGPNSQLYSVKLRVTEPFPLDIMSKITFNEEEAQYYYDHWKEWFMKD